MNIFPTVIAIKAKKEHLTKRGNDSIKINAKPTAFQFIIVQ